MNKWLFSNGTKDPVASFALLFLRIAIGSMMLLGHGWGKFENFSTLQEKFLVPEISILSSWMNSTTSLTCTIFAEVICAALLVLGLATRPAALIFSFTMAIAAFVVHEDAPFFFGPNVTSSKELAVLYLVGGLTLLITGGGSYCLDAKFSIHKRRIFN
jgi:putative oxidoreductase